jgi:hypothetical protein
MKIEYLEKFRELGKDGEKGILNLIRSRHEMCRAYSFALPTPKAVRTLVDFSPLVEIGAGTGYWAMLVKQAGGEVVAYDLCPGKGNKYSFTRDFGNVLPGDERALFEIDSRHTLFLCWPNYNTDFAYNCLSFFNGRRIVYIGEEKGGCTASDRFFESLRVNWILADRVSIPQWPGIHDSLFVYERRDVEAEPGRPRMSSRGLP